MGADSSTLQSIESLNSTLEDIEKKLFVIEDVHLHHERTISHDDSVLISGKKIGCRSGVRLLCGPVLGVIGSSWARIMVEVDADAELSFNVFVTDGKLICTRYMFSVTMFASKGVPISTKIEGLQAGTNYTVYIGGITASETVTNATFQTMPEEATAVRVVLAHNGRLDRLMPGESNLWKEIENRVTAPQTCLPGYVPIAPIDTDVEDEQLYLPYTDEPTAPRVHLLCHHGNLISIEPIIRSRAMELLDLLVREDSNYEDWTNVLEQTEAQIKTAFRNALTSPSLCKILRRCGNVFLIGPEEAGAITTALLALNIPEKLAYRPPVEAEDALYPSTPGSAMAGVEGLDGTTEDGDMGSETTSTKGGTSTKSGKSGVLSSPTATSKRGGGGKMKKGKSKKNMKAVVTADTIADDARKQLIPVAEDTTDRIGDVDLTPVVGSAVRRFYDAGQLAVKSKVVVQENLRRLLAGLLVRSFRRISRSYLRQLWDDDHLALSTEDAEKEIFFRSMLRLQKVLQVKTHMRTILESSRLRLSKEFGADNRALEHLALKSKILGEEITALEMDLRESAVRSGELAVTASAQPNGVTLQLGTLGLVLVESSWGWLGRDDQLLFPMVQEVEIHEQIQAQLEQMLVPVPPRATHNLDDEPTTSEVPADSVGAAASEKRGHAPVLLAEGHISKSGKHFDEGSEEAQRVYTPPPPVKAVLCVSTCPLLPHSPTLQTSDVDPSKSAAGKPITLRSIDATAPAGFTLSSLDVRRVLQVLAKWQQESPDRAVLLSGPAPSNVDSAVGYAYPFVVNYKGQEITSDAQFDDPENVMLDIWNKDRSRLHQILVGDLSRANRTSVAYFQDLALLQALSKNASDAQLAASTVTDRSTQFKSYYDRSSQCTRRCFWDVCFSPQLPPLIAPDSSTGVRAAPPAGFVTDCVTDGRRGAVQFTLGPVIGGVTPTSANVLVQVSETAPLELMCVDQVTGAEYLCSRLAAAHRPCLFEFEHLLPNHAYDVILLTTVGVAAGPAHSSCVLWGSFTTLRNPRSIVAAVESGAAPDRHVVSNLRMGTGGGASVAGSATVATDDASQAQGRGGNHSSASVRLLLLGADKPSWRHKLPRAASHSAMERQYISRGVSLCQEVSNCVSQGWSGIDVVIHCGHAVDWGSCIDGVLDLLTQAEVLQGLYTGALSTSNYAVRSNNLPRILAPAQSNTRPYSNGDYLAGSRNSYNVEMDTSHGVTAHSLLLQALEQLRGAYLAHWGATPHTSTLLAHGNHYFLNSPAFDLLTVFHAASLRDLRRNLSPYCVQHLMEFMGQLQLEYQQQLQFPAQSITLHHQHGDHHVDGSGADSRSRANVPYLKFLDGGAVAMFELQPNFTYSQDSLNRVGDHLISEEQVQALHHLLFPTIIGVVDGTNKAAMRSFASSNLHTLVLLSPIPLLLDSDTYTEYSNLSSQQKGIRYPQREILHLLDTLAQWLEVSPAEREVLIITGGVATSFITTVTIEHLQRLGSPMKSPKRSAHHLPLSPHSPHALDAHHSAHDLQEGSFASGTSNAGGVSHPLRLRQMCCGTAVGIREDSLPQSDGVLHSNQRRYKFVHRACSYGTGAEIMVTTGMTRPQTAATSGTAAAAEAARAADAYPQCGLVEIATLETRAQAYRQQQMQVQMISQMQQSSHTGAPEHSTDTTGAQASAMLKFLDQSGLRAYFQRGWPALLGSLESHSTHQPGGASVMSLSLKGKNAEDIAYDGRSLLRHSSLATVPGLYQVMQDLQSQLPHDVASMRPPTVEPFVADIKRAMDIVCKRERQSFEECHRLYLRHEVFPLPSSGGYNVEKCLLSCTQYIVQRMSPALRKICKIPSSSIIRFAWEHFERDANRIVKHSSDAAVHGKDGVQQVNVLAEFVSASIAGDVDYFIKVVRCCLELQIVAEYMAYARGLLDGAER